MFSAYSDFAPKTLVGVEHLSVRDTLLNYGPAR